MRLFKGTQDGRTFQSTEQSFDDEIHAFGRSFNRLTRCLVTTLAPSIPMLQAKTAFELKEKRHNFGQAPLGHLFIF
jgi:hypothetical protein